VFGAELSKAKYGRDHTVPVKLMGIVESDKPLSAEYNPDHPLANDEGYIYKPNVNVMEEMANMISASRSYQTNVQVADASKQMLLRTLQMGQ
jgi:flagellar basal-body rod protein FlgC